MIKRPCYTYSVSETDELNDFLSFTFPPKHWDIFANYQLESIWWDKSGIWIVINEELLKKRVLESKEPFRIFETNSMSLV